MLFLVKKSIDSIELSQASTELLLDEYVYENKFTSILIDAKDGG
jgi:hypothetical protein